MLRIHPFSISSTALGVRRGIIVRRGVGPKGACTSTSAIASVTASTSASASSQSAGWTPECGLVRPPGSGAGQRRPTTCAALIPRFGLWPGVLRMTSGRGLVLADQATQDGPAADAALDGRSRGSRNSGRPVRDVVHWSRIRANGCIASGARAGGPPPNTRYTSISTGTQPASVQHQGCQHVALAWLPHIHA